MICDGNYRITNCVAKWPGSVHDSRIYRESSISHAFENGNFFSSNLFLENYIHNW